MIHPDVAAKNKKSAAHMPVILLLNEEREALFTGAATVIMFQVIYLAILTDYFTKVDITHTNNFSIMIPRVFSCILMHLIVVPDLRQGLRLMKFAIKHPWFFTVIEEEVDDEVDTDEDDDIVEDKVDTELTKKATEMEMS